MPVTIKLDPRFEYVRYSNHRTGFLLFHFSNFTISCAVSSRTVELQVFSLTEQSTNPAKRALTATALSLVTD